MADRYRSGCCARARLFRNLLQPAIRAPRPLAFGIAAGVIGSGAGEQREEYWRQQIVPYLDSVWPDSQVEVTPALSAMFARLCVAAREGFPQAIERLERYLQPLESTYRGVHDLAESQLCSRFPDEALDFLFKIAGDGRAKCLSKDLMKCSAAIGVAKPAPEEECELPAAR